MNYLENLPPALHAKDLFEQSTRSLQGLSRLPTALQAMTDVARQHQERLQACAFGGDTFREARQAAARLAEPYAEMRRLAQTLGDTCALPTALQELAESSQRQQALHLAAERAVGYSSSLAKAALAWEVPSQRCGEMQQGIEQAVGSLQSQWEQAAALARGVGGVQSQTLFALEGFPHQPITFYPYTDHLGAVSFRSRGAQDEISRLLLQELVRRGVETIDAVRQDDAHRQDKRYHEILTALHNLERLIVPQDQPQAERVTPVPETLLPQEPRARPTPAHQNRGRPRGRGKIYPDPYYFVELLGKGVDHFRQEKHRDPTRKEAIAWTTWPDHLPSEDVLKNRFGDMKTTYSQWLEERPWPLGILPH